MDTYHLTIYKCTTLNVLRFVILNNRDEIVFINSNFIISNKVSYTSIKRLILNDVSGHSNIDFINKVFYYSTETTLVNVYLNQSIDEVCSIIFLYVDIEQN